jgi:hypothetical protein
MAGRRFFAARMVADRHRRMALLSLARIADTRSLRRRPRLGLSHPRSDGNHRPAI